MKRIHSLVRLLQARYLVHQPPALFNFVPGMEKILTVTTRKPFESADGGRTAKKYHVIARNTEVEDSTFELNADEKPVSVDRGSSGRVFLGQFQGDLVAIE
ncbi:hypothetical protein QAD02_021783 [Eretmocerus hayati]|uniref:Uncharacterized protein n=1 Tax=Eretmocerus hayati TaxID=131215 RepID=A0ACC2PQV6_9HYME|nr:hypothetical protein QAD02_021783 [Eretmocerus hayati]